MGRFLIVLVLVSAAAAADLDALRARFAAEPSAAVLDEVAALESLAAAEFLWDVARGEEHAGWARVALGRMRAGEVLRFFRARLGVEEAADRRLAARVLGGIPGFSITDDLLARRAKEDDPSVRAALADALRSRADPKKVRELRRAVRGGDFRSRASAVSQLVAYARRDEAVVAVVVDLLRSPDFEERILALDATGGSAKPAYAAAAADSLEHRLRAVRVAPAEALGKSRLKLSIEPLIAALEREKETRVRTALATALHRITGENLRDFAELWRKWWEARKAAYEVPASSPKKKAPKKGARKTVATFYDVPVDGDRIVFVVDRSASMTTRDGPNGERRFTVAIQELLDAVAELPKTARINVIFFASDLWIWKKRLVPVTRKTRARLEAAVGNLEPGGGTYLYDGLKAALETDDVDTIFVMSDGQPSGGEIRDPAGILHAVGKLNRFRRAAIHCIAVGEPSALLRRIARAHAGTYVEK